MEKQIIEMIDKLYANTSVPQSTTRSQLLAIITHCQILNEAMGDFDEDDES